MIKTCLATWLIGASVQALAQQQPPTAKVGRDTIAIVAVPGETEVTSPSTGIRRYANNVRLHHRGTQFFCDEAIHQLATDRIIAHGHIRVVQGDSITSSSDSLRYDGATQKATFAGNVIFEHNSAELTTARLDYNLITGAVQYKGESRFSDGPNILTSLQGKYDTQTRHLKAAEQVALATPHTTLRYDTLQYVLSDKPVPAIDFAEATQLDASDIVRQRTAAQHRAGTADKPAPKAVAAQVQPPTDSTKLAGSPTSLRVSSVAKRPSRPTPPPPTAAAVPQTSAESELERLLNKPRQTR
ncbi:OstA-like protein [Fibrella sp. WM1]|uniref:OstA-like protein n=1 Tax=Fibrella musci TaxID=3242485 RepID=UPI003522D5FF